MKIPFFPLRWLKRFTPKGLFSRSLLIIIIPTVLMQTVAIYTFYARHWESVSRNMAETLAGEISFVVSQVEDKSRKEREQVLNDARNTMKLGVTFDAKGSLPKKSKNSQYNFLEGTLKKHFNNDFRILEDEKEGIITIVVQAEKGVLTIRTTDKKINNPSTYIYVFWVIGSTALFFVIAMIFMKNQVRPIVRLAEAAQRFGRGMDLGEFKPSGAREVRRAGKAFVVMSRRIKRQVQQRIEMLAGISHDLRTPLARIRLQMALLAASKNKEKDIEAMKGDIDEMEKMINSYLDYARDESGVNTHEQVVSLDVKQELLNVFGQVDKSTRAIIPAQKIMAGYGWVEKPATLKPRGENDPKQILYSFPDGDVFIKVQPLAFRRAIRNIIENAVKYGNQVLVSLSAGEEGSCVITIEDDGPGIPLKERFNAFKPFYRLDKSRNAKTGGVGLGLSVARKLIQQNQGRIELATSEALGGLRVSVGF